MSWLTEDPMEIWPGLDVDSQRRKIEKDKRCLRLFQTLWHWWIQSQRDSWNNSKDLGLSVLKCICTFQISALPTTSKHWEVNHKWHPLSYSWQSKSINIKCTNQSLWTWTVWPQHEWSEKLPAKSRPQVHEMKTEWFSTAACSPSSIPSSPSGKTPMVQIKISI